MQTQQQVVNPQSMSDGLDAYSLSGNITLPGNKQGSIDYFITDHRSDPSIHRDKCTHDTDRGNAMGICNGKYGVL